MSDIERLHARIRWIIFNRPWETAMRYMRRYSHENGALAGIEFRLMFLQVAYNFAKLSDHDKSKQILADDETLKQVLYSDA